MKTKIILTAALLATTSLTAQAEQTLDPYAPEAQAKVYQSNEFGAASQPPKSNVFTKEEVDVEVITTPAPRKVTPESEKGLLIQEEEAKVKKGVDRRPLNKRDDAYIPHREYSPAGTATTETEVRTESNINKPQEDGTTPYQEFHAEEKKGVMRIPAHRRESVIMPR